MTPEEVRAFIESFYEANRNNDWRVSAIDFSLAKVKSKDYLTYMFSAHGLEKNQAYREGLAAVDGSHLGDLFHKNVISRAQYERAMSVQPPQASLGHQRMPAQAAQSRTQPSASQLQSHVSGYGPSPSTSGMNQSHSQPRPPQSQSQSQSQSRARLPQPSGLGNFGQSSLSHWDGRTGVNLNFVSPLGAAYERVQGTAPNNPDRQVIPQLRTVDPRINHESLPPMIERPNNLGNLPRHVPTHSSLPTPSRTTPADLLGMGAEMTALRISQRQGVSGTGLRGPGGATEGGVPVSSATRPYQQSSASSRRPPSP